MNFKTTKKSYKSKKVIHNSPEEQVVYENTQPALIDQDSFDRVQALRANSRQRHIKCGELGLFSGFLFCADCRSKMYHPPHHPQGAEAAGYGIQHPNNQCEALASTGIYINAVSVWIVFCKYCSHRIKSPYRSINHLLQKSDIIFL